MNPRTLPLRLLVAAVTLPCVGTAQQQIWNPSPPSNQAFGFSVSGVGDMNGDQRSEYVVADPNASPLGKAFAGTVTLFDSSGSVIKTHFGENPQDRFGTVVEGVGDINGDGFPDFMVLAPNYDGVAGMDTGKVYLYSSLGPLLWSWEGPLPGALAGASLAGTLDLNGDGKRNILVGAYLFDAPAGNSSGRVYIFNSVGFQIGFIDGPVVGGQFGVSIAGVRGSSSDFGFIIGANGTSAPTGFATGRVYAYGPSGNFLWSRDGREGGENFGLSVVIAGDLDGDARDDVVAGGPAHDGTVGSNSGRIEALSTFGSPLWDVDGQVPLDAFGYSLDTLGDVTGDCWPDLVVGGTDAFGAAGASVGRVYLVDGAGFSRWFVEGTLAGRRLGTSVSSAGDLDGDGLSDLLGGGQSIAGAWKHLGGAATYCVAKVNSLGCTPSINTTGFASVSSAFPFTVRANLVLNNKNGILFYGFGTASIPFQGGTLCVQPPLKRTPITNSSGSLPPAQDCSGVLQRNLNFQIQSGLDPGLTTGTTVYAQWWYRDAASPSTTGLSNGIRFSICP